MKTHLHNEYKVYLYFKQKLQQEIVWSLQSMLQFGYHLLGKNWPLPFLKKQSSILLSFPN